MWRPLSVSCAKICSWKQPIIQLDGTQEVATVCAAGFVSHIRYQRGALEQTVMCCIKPQPGPSLAGEIWNESVTELRASWRRTDCSCP